MSKKRIYVILSIVLTVLLVIIGVIAIAGLTGEKKEPLPIIDKGSSENSIDTSPEAKLANLQKLLETKQFKEGSESEYANFFANGNSNQLQPPYLALAAWTVSKYVDNSIINPYFVSGYWGVKDSYRQGSIDTYIYPYISKELKPTFVFPVDSVEAASSEKVFIPDSSLTIAPQCFDTWAEESCFSDTPSVTDFAYEGLSETSVRVNFTVSMSVLYQKPESPEGNLIAQDRTYHMTMVLSEQNKPKNLDTEIPIMIIDSIDSSLEIKGTSDYLINEN